MTAEINDTRKLDWRCVVCRECTQLQYFMVSKEVWNQAMADIAPAPGSHRFMCVECMEERIGRRLEPADFPENIILNSLPTGSPILSDRTGRELTLATKW